MPIKLTIVRYGSALLLGLGALATYYWLGEPAFVFITGLWFGLLMFDLVMKGSL